ncbi:MAG TPA: translation elongation factor Ts [Ignavibacteriaceae bacterium]|nr:translation elongation factor Ts [Ignavibacteriaceae bacterium]
MEITAALVNNLRQKTGAGMMDCKKALTEANGDIEKAIEILRKKGAAVAAKRAEKTANEGLVLSKVMDNGSTGVIIEVNCETDFVAKSPDFTDFANSVLNAVIETKPSTVEELFEKNPDLKVKHNDLLGKIGEKIEVSRFSINKLDDGMAVDYIHPGSKLGVLVLFEKAKSAKEDFSSIGKDIAMQIAAMKPICTYREEVPKDLVDKELEIYKELARKEGKPENILEKIATGRLNKFYQENCLFEQAYIKDNAKTVGDLIKEYNSKNGIEIKIKGFKRFHLGDEKK